MSTSQTANVAGLCARIAAGVAILLFALFVWPTPYQYWSKGVTQYRRNRLTNSIQYYHDSTWTAD